MISESLKIGYQTIANSHWSFMLLPMSVKSVGRSPRFHPYSEIQTNEFLKYCLLLCKDKGIWEVLAHQ